MLKKSFFLFSALLLSIFIINTNTIAAMDNSMDTSPDNGEDEDVSLAGILSGIANLKIEERPQDLFLEIAKKMPFNSDNQVHFGSIGMTKELRDRIVKWILIEEYRKTYDKPGYKNYSETELLKLKDHQLFDILLESPVLKKSVSNCAEIMQSIIKSEKSESGSSSSSSSSSTTSGKGSSSKKIEVLENLTLKELFKEFRKTQFFKTHTQVIHKFIVTSLCKLTQAETLESISINDLLTHFRDIRPVKISALEPENTTPVKTGSLRSLRRNQSVQLFVYLFTVYFAYDLLIEYNSKTIYTNSQYTTDGQRQDATVLSFLFWGFISLFPTYWYTLFCQSMNEKYY